MDNQNQQRTNDPCKLQMKQDFKFKSLFGATMQLNFNSLKVKYYQSRVQE